MIIWPRCRPTLRQEQLLTKLRLHALHPFLSPVLRAYSNLERFKSSFAQLLVPAPSPSCHIEHTTAG